MRKKRYTLGHITQCIYKRQRTFNISSEEEGGSVLWIPSKEIHDGCIPQFCMSVTGQFKNDAMLRQVSEAVKINREGKRNCVNSKNEWNYMNLLHMGVE